MEIWSWYRMTPCKPSSIPLLNLGSFFSWASLPGCVNFLFYYSDPALNPPRHRMLNYGPLASPNFPFLPTPSAIEGVGINHTHKSVSV